MKTIHATLLLSLAVTGCGRADVSSENQGPVQDQQPASFPQGIYVASYSGDDANAGTPDAPLRSINAAIRMAQGTDAQDVYVIGGDLNGGHTEVVVLREGVNLHGSICPTDFPPLKVDPDACRTTISGGTPTLLAEGIDETTLVENFHLAGKPGVQTESDTTGFFEVPGAGCMGRGTMTAGLSPCQPSLDEEGRMLPQPSMGVVIANSRGVVFRGVHVESNAGADGLPGADGAAGMAGVPGMPGRNAGAEDWNAGKGGVAPEAPCAEARGGHGGRGGRFQWDGRTWYSKLTGETVIFDDTEHDTLPADMIFDGFAPKLIANTGAQGENGRQSVLGATGGEGRPWQWDTQAGAAGAAGGDGQAGAQGAAGFGGSDDLQTVSLLAKNGASGAQGKAGQGGAGGGGGAPGTRTHSKRKDRTSGWSVVGIAGASGGSSTAFEATAGATAGGGGGAGGSGGCGGEGGRGGQGGAASVAILLVDAELSLNAASVKAGPGGNGGRGGIGGAGGIGAQGGDPGNGAAMAPSNVTGTFKDHANVTVFGKWFSKNTSGSTTDSWSASQGGNGGVGGRGGNGGNGGVGGGGAGGASIGILSKGTSAVVMDAATTVETSAPGIGAGEGEAKGQDGLAAVEHAI